MLNPNPTPLRRSRSVFLDLALLLLPRLPVLLLVPLAVGALVYAFAAQLPKTYVSASIIALPQGPSRMTPQQVASMLVSPVVLDAVVDPARNGQGLNRDEARGELARRIKTGVGKDQLVRLEVEGPTPEETRATAEAILNSWLKSTVPSEREQGEMKRRLAVATAGFENAQKALQHLLQDPPNTIGSRERGISVVAVGELSDRYLDQMLIIPRQLEGMPREVIKQPPTLPVQPIRPRKRLLAAAATGLAFFAVLAGVLLCYLLEAARADPARAETLRELRAALPGTRARKKDQVHA